MVAATVGGGAVGVSVGGVVGVGTGVSVGGSGVAVGSGTAVDVSHPTKGKISRQGGAYVGAGVFRGQGAA